jgi:hypothetical protein
MCSRFDVDGDAVCFHDQRMEIPWQLQEIGEYAQLRDHVRSRRWNQDVYVLLEKMNRLRQRWLSLRGTASVHCL